MRIWSWQHVSSVAELSPVYCCLVSTNFSTDYSIITKEVATITKDVTIITNELTQSPRKEFSNDFFHQFCSLILFTVFLPIFPPNYVVFLKLYFSKLYFLKCARLVHLPSFASLFSLFLLGFKCFALSSPRTQTTLKKRLWKPIHYHGFHSLTKNIGKIIKC